MKLYVFVKGISEAGEADQNRIDLIGYICKQPLYRETPLGKEITDILIAVNRKHRKSDYLRASSRNKSESHGNDTEQDLCKRRQRENSL